MRRFLGGNLAGSGAPTASNGTATSANQTGDNASILSGETTAASATKRAFQQFGQSAFSKSINGAVRKASLPFTSPSATPESEVPPQVQHGGLVAGESAYSPAPPPIAKSPYMPNGGNTTNGSEEDLDAWDAIKLPFGNSQGGSSDTNTLRNEGLPSAYAVNASGLVDLKDDMMMELLSSDALLHVGQFEILGFDEVEELRKEHSILTTRLTILTNKLAVETKIRDAAVSLSRLYTSKRMSRQADDTLDNANRKVEAAANELNKIAKREAEVKTRILRHMAAVLGLMLRRIEGSDRNRTGSSTGPSPRATPLPPGSDRSLLSPNSIASPTFSNIGSALIGASAIKFEGAHMFAGNRDAVMPNPRSPFTSPSLGASTGSFSSLPYGHSLQSPALSTNTAVLPYATNGQSESQVRELSAELADCKDRLEQQARFLEDLRQEKIELQERLQLAESDNRAAQERNRNIEDEQSGHSQQLQRELEKVQHELVHARRMMEDNAEDAEVWEKQVQDLQQQIQEERNSNARSLEQTLQRHAQADSPFGVHISAHLRGGPPDVQDFLSKQLDTLLSDTGRAHIEALDGSQVAQSQIRSLQQAKDDHSRNRDTELADLVQQIEGLEKEKRDLRDRVTQLSRDKDGLNRAVEEMQRDVEAQRDSAAVEAKAAEKKALQRLQDAERALSQRNQEAEQEKRSFRGRMDNLQNELQEIRTAKQAMIQSLQQVSTLLPSDQVIQQRLALQDTDDIAAYKAAFSGPQGAQANRQSFSAEQLTNRIDGTLQGQARLLRRLITYETNATTHKASAERAQKLLQESKTSLQTYATQVKELEERAGVSAEKEVQMLERLNDVQAALETARNNAKRAESKVAELEQRCTALQKEKDALANKPNDSDKLKRELSDVKEELAIAQDELDEMRSKESRQRVQLLEEMTSLTEEASQLRTQLRTAQRKLKEFERV